MNDEQIVNALECCATAYDCPDCPFECDCGSMQNLKTATVDLINRQKAEIERLKRQNERLEYAFVAECELSACPRKKEIRGEAIKEFVKKMSNILFLDSYSTKKIEEKMRAVKKDMEGESE